MTTYVTCDSARFDNHVETQISSVSKTMIMKESAVQSTSTGPILDLSTLHQDDVLDLATRSYKVAVEYACSMGWMAPIGPLAQNVETPTNNIASQSMALPNDIQADSHVFTPLPGPYVDIDPADLGFMDTMTTDDPAPTNDLADLPSTSGVTYRDGKHRKVTNAARPARATGQKNRQFELLDECVVLRLGDEVPTGKPVVYMCRFCDKIIKTRGNMYQHEVACQNIADN